MPEYRFQKELLEPTVLKIQYECYWIRYCCSLESLDRHLGSIISLFDGTGTSFSEVKLSGPKGDHTPLSSKEFKNA